MLLEDWDGTWLDIFKRLKPGNIVYFVSKRDKGRRLATYTLLYGRNVFRALDVTVLTYEGSLNKRNMSSDYYIEVATPLEVLEEYETFSAGHKTMYAKLIVQRILEDAV